MSSAEQRKERGGCKKGGGGGSSQLRKSPVHSLKASQRKIHTKHTGGGGGEIQQQEKLSTLCNNLTYTRYKKKKKEALKSPRRHQQSLVICQQGTEVSVPPFFQLKTRANGEAARATTWQILPLGALKASCKQHFSPSPPRKMRAPLPRPDPPLASHDQSPAPHSSSKSWVASDI